ncbi:MCE family protein [Pseudorhodobacter sp. E13]|uniref:MlaD family protein n=1 Tax=Pseudorhodobacter sp. E13 TaxID=2487931 RepID=UPI000F8C8945|nr:MlaD family protein [Pseudorhodobacter sp. E13]RUS59544.1 MCE family protein [Pseudorhodobacter sp. E13]
MTMPDLPEMDVTPAKRSPWRNLSFVWLVPILALIISMAVAWQSYNNKGTLITIVFKDAAGITPKDTTIRFRDVIIGAVEEVNFSKDMAQVEISARINKDVADTFTPETLFWVVRPEVSARGISGLSTVLSGVYIDSDWVPTQDSAERDFVGLSETPLIRPGNKGTRVKIRSKNGTSLTPGAPVFFRGMEVGHLDTPRLSETGDSTDVEAFINAPYDKFLTTDSRFWNLAGFSVTLGPAGLDLNVASLGSLLTGGVAFENIVSGGQPVTDDTLFRLFANETAARESIFTQLSANSVTMSVVFGESISGLAAGAPVEYRGLRIGQVNGIGAFIVKNPAGSSVNMRAVIAIDPQSLGLGAEAGEDVTRSFVEKLVADGMRARLSTTSIFSSALKIELAEVPDALPARLEDDADGTPVIPSVKSDLPDFTATAEGVLERVNNLPIEDVMNQAISLMASIEAIAVAPGTQRAPDAILGLLEDARGLIGKEDTQAIPTELRAVIADLRSIVGELKERGAVDQLSSALASIDKASADFATASGDLPKLIEDLRAIAAKVNDLKAEELIASVTRVMDSTDALIGTEGARSIPPALASALEEVQVALKELREGGAIENTNATLASAREAADAVAKAAKDFPDVTAQLDSVISKADALISAYGAKSTFNSETLDLLRELKAAAKSVAQLARTIERNPNSLILGR